MNESALFVLVPLAVLPILLLFRFCGCAQIAGLDDYEPGQLATPADEKPPDYRRYILGEKNNPGVVHAHPRIVPNGADVIGYWRLVDPGIDPGRAADEKGLRHGDFRLSTATETLPGDFAPGLALIASAPDQHCRLLNGGYVRVEPNESLRGDFYTDEFTIEAWISRSRFAAGSTHTLFHAGGHFTKRFESTAAYHGFRVFASGDRWQIQIIGMPGPAVPAASAPIIPAGRSHLAVTVETAALGKKRFTIFVNGKSTASVEAGPYSPPAGAPLLIGVGIGTADPADTVHLTSPVYSHVQEVVLHRKALSPPEIENHVDINRS